MIEGRKVFGMYVLLKSAPLFLAQVLKSISMMTMVITIDKIRLFDSDNGSDIFWKIYRITIALNNEILCQYGQYAKRY